MIKRRPKLPQADRLQMYFGEPYVIDLPEVPGSFTIIQPTIGDLVRFGEKNFFPTLGIFTTNTTQYRAMLWEQKIDWNEISDFELFCLLYKGINPDAAKMLFGDNIDFSRFEIKTLPTTDGPQLVLYDAEDNIGINDTVYYMISDYLRDLFNMHPEDEYTEDKILKKWWVEKDQREENRKKDKEESSASIQSLISACVNHPGFKYNLQELKNVGVAQFYDSVRRLQLYESATAVMKGMYSGMVDSKKIPPESYNWMGDIK